MMDTHADMVFNGEKEKASMFGLGVASADIDNDGFDDILVGAQDYDHGRGRIYLFWGGYPMDTSCDLVFEGENPGDWFGRIIDAGGDVNGDGYYEILIGARQWGDNKGRAYLYFGNTKECINTVCDRTFTGDSQGDEMGSSVEMFDIDNDGLDDVVVGARFAADYRGRVYIYWGDKNFDGSFPDLILEGEPGSDMGGDAIACGYFDDDHYGDILAGAYNYPGAAYKRGRAYVFLGSNRDSMDSLADHIFEGETGHQGRFGCKVSSGDFNDDKYDDVVIGAWGYSNGQGRTYLYYGPFSNTDDITFRWDTTNASIGEHILKVEIPPIPGEQNMADNVLTATVHVKIP